MAGIELHPQEGMRLTSLVVMIYDTIITLPSEIRLYKRQKSFLRPSLPCILFVLARYSGLFYVCWVTYVFFGTGWTLSACARIAPVGSTLRSFASTITSVVFMWRTWAIWQRNGYILFLMGLILVPVTVFSYVPGLIQKPAIIDGGCTAVSSGGGPLSYKWTFALVNLIYDAVAFVLATYRLLTHVRGWDSTISKILLTDGLGYFLIAVAVQTANLVFLLNPDPAKQGTMLTFQAVMTAILCQRIITSPYERTRIYESTVPEPTLDRDPSNPVFRNPASNSLRRPPPTIGSAFSRITGRSSRPGQESGLDVQANSEPETIKLGVKIDKSRIQRDDDSFILKDDLDRTTP